ncbi:hypothetical protein SLA2020_313370 [Shorea laevis]
MAFPRLPPPPPGSDPPRPPPDSSTEHTFLIIIGALVGIALILLVIFIICRHRKGPRKNDLPEAFVEMVESCVIGPAVSAISAELV